MPLLDGPSLGGNARHVLRQYAEENALARGRGANAAGTEEFGGGCLRGRYNNLREVIQNNPSLVVVPSIINAGSLFVQRPICRTNYLPNNSMAGATGGVLPTNWSIASLPAGITVSYSASGTAVAADGTSVNYIDVTVSGTAGASGFLNIRPNPSPSTIAAFVGQSWNTSVYLQLISGSVASISPTWQLQELNSSQTFLQGSNIGGLGSLVVGGQFDRYNVSRVLTDSATAFVTCRWGHSFVSGTTYSYTLRIGSPQLERFSVPTPMIATSTGAVTRLNESTDVVGLPPDFTVSRNTGATRVGPNGLIETAKTNLALQSAGFQVSGTWAPTNITVTTGSTAAFTAPDGSTDADLLTSTASGSARIIQPFSFVSGTTYTYSAFAKAGSGFFGLTMENGGVASGVAVIWNLNTGALAVSGVVGTGYTLQSQGIENYGNGWYRCRMTVLMSVSVAGNIRANTSNGTMTTAIIQSDNGNNVYVWGAQLEVGSTASEYIPTTTVARTRFAGVTVDGTIAANIPRIDWLGQSCPALLVEASGQNLVFQSQNITSGTVTSGSQWFDSASLQGTSTSVQNNVSGIIAPDGTQSASLVSMTRLNVTGSTGSLTYVSQIQNLAVSGTYTSTIYIRAKDSNQVGKQINVWQWNGSATINMILVTLTNDWQRVETTKVSTLASGNRELLAFGFRQNQGNDLSAEFYVWGAQGELGSVATTYIPTTAAAVSRAADVISASGALVSGLIGQTEGTMYAEVDVRNISGLKAIIQLDNGTGDNRLLIQLSSPNTLNFFAANGGSVSTIASGTITTGTHKIAASYSSGNVQIYMDGLFLASGTMANYPSLALSNVSIGSRIFSGVQGNFLNDRIRAAALYTTRLSNAQLAELTRL